MKNTMTGRVFFFSILSSLALSGSHSAYADREVQLNFIDTNDCKVARAEVNLLNSSLYPIYTQCSPAGVYASDNGRSYAYRLTTWVTLPDSAGPGTVIRLNPIDTDECIWAESEIDLLDSPGYAIDADCSDSRLTTRLTVNE